MLFAGYSQRMDRPDLFLIANRDAVTDPAVARTKPKLLDQVRDAIRARHYARRTERAYVGWVRRFVLFHGKRHPNEMGGPQVAEFLTSLAVDRAASAWATQNRAPAALLGYLCKAVLDQGFAVALGSVVHAKLP